MEDRYDRVADDLWSALTDPGRLPADSATSRTTCVSAASSRRDFFASGWEGTGRVETCEPPRRLLVLTRMNLEEPFGTPLKRR